MTKPGDVIITLALSCLFDLRVAGSIYGRCDNAGDTFNCSGVGLTVIPGEEDIPMYKKILILSYNDISNVTFLGYPALSKSLSTLDLSNNHISVLKSDAFRLLTNLISLDLSNNIVSGSSLTERMFNDLKKLNYLSMEKNPLRQIKRNTFNFLELPSLKHLDLSHCEISELEENALDLSSLEYLDLSWNMLKSFSRDSFRMLVNLKTLDMSHNRISVLIEVPYMPELVTWILDSNGIETIKIREELQYYADNIHELHLRNNNVKRFDADSFPLDDLEYLQVIDLTNNKLTCDCKMRWIQDDNYNFKTKNYTFICNSPQTVKNNNLLEMLPEELKCGYSLRKMLFIVVISSVALLLCLTASFFVVRRRCRKRRERSSARGDNSGNYTAVYTRDDDDIRVTMPDTKGLLINETDREFDA